MTDHTTLTKNLRVAADALMAEAKAYERVVEHARAEFLTRLYAYIDAEEAAAHYLFRELRPSAEDGSDLWDQFDRTEFCELQFNEDNAETPALAVKAAGDAQANATALEDFDASACPDRDGGEYEAMLYAADMKRRMRREDAREAQ